MADYYPLIARAIAGLSSSTPETRGAIYERARNALLGQLRRLDPPIPEADVERESAALDNAIARLEAELAPPPDVEPPVEDRAPEPLDEAVFAPVEAPAPPAAIETRAPPPEPPLAEPPAPEQPAEERPEDPDASWRSAPAAAEPGVEAGIEKADAPESPVKPQPAPPPAFFKVRRDKPLFTPPPRPDGFPARRAPGSAPLYRSPLGPTPAASAPAPAEAAPAEAALPAPDSFVPEFSPTGPGADAVFPDSGEASVASDSEPIAAPEAAADASAEAPDGVDDTAAGRRISPALAKLRPEAQRPYAPQRKHDDRTPRRLWIVGFVVGLLVLLVAIAAFQLRDRAEDLRQKAATAVIAPEAASNGKIVDRIGVGSDPAQRGQSADRESAVKSPATADDSTSSARRAALLVEAPDEPSKVRTYLGSVVWRVDNVSNGPGDPLGMAVRAEIDIPEEKLQTVMTLQKNSDSSLPASHTMKIQFIEPADSPFGGIQQINVPQMRREDTPTGDALSGIPVSITENSFLVGLTRGPSEASNLDLLTSREWIDVPMLLSNGKIAKLTFEKGPAGNRAFTDALAAWKAQ